MVAIRHISGGEGMDGGWGWNKGRVGVGGVGG